MTEERHPTRTPEPVEPREEDDPGLAGGGGPASIIYGESDEGEDSGDEMLKAPNEGA